MDNIDIQYLFSRLKTSRLSASEAHDLFLFVKYRNNELENLGLDLNEILRYATKVLGRIGNK